MKTWESSTGNIIFAVEGRFDRKEAIELIKTSITDVSITDNTEYVSGKSANGGCYSFTRHYHKISSAGETKWQVSYSTSADFGYCDVCGSWLSNGGYCQHCYSYNQEDKPYEEITTEELIVLIEETMKDINMEVRLVKENKKEA